MCGRIRSSVKTSNFFKINGFERRPKTSENLPPGKEMTVIMSRKPDPTKNAQDMIWGLIPSSSLSKNSPRDHFMMFNCRIETITEKSSFKHLLSKGNSCILCADGFYEWKLDAGGKQPYYITSKTEEPLCMPGLYNETIIDGEVLYTFTIITCEASNNFSNLHNRQPVFLESDQIDLWLSANRSSIPSLLNHWQQTDVREKSVASLHWYPVSSRVSLLTYQGDDCATPLKSTQKKIGSFFSPSKIGRLNPTSSVIASAATSTAKSTPDYNAIKSASNSGKNAHSNSLDELSAATDNAAVCDCVSQSHEHSAPSKSPTAFIDLTTDEDNRDPKLDDCRSLAPLRTAMTHSKVLKTNRKRKIESVL